MLRQVGRLVVTTWLSLVAPVVTLLSVAAPAPLTQRPPRVKTVVGTWWMTWDRAGYLVTLSADGRYSCTAGTCTWLGGWSLKDNQLLVSEVTSQHPQDSTYQSPLLWSMDLTTLDSKALAGGVLLGKGTVEGRAAFLIRLEPTGGHKTPERLPMPRSDFRGLLTEIIQNTGRGSKRHGSLRALPDASMDTDGVLVWGVSTSWR